MAFLQVSWPSEGSSLSVYRFYLIRFLISSLLFMPGLARAESLAQTIDSILKDRTDFEDRALRFELDNLPIDREDLPVVDGESGAINIPGKTPRDKAVSEFLRSVADYDRALLNASKKDHQLRESLMDSRETHFPLRVIIKSESDGSIWMPLRVKVSLGDNRDIELTHVPGLKVEREFEILHTALKSGRHSIRVSGVAARLSEGGTARPTALRDPQPFQEVIDIDLDEQGRAPNELVLVLKDVESDLRLERLADADTERK